MGEGTLAERYLLTHGNVMPTDFPLQDNPNGNRLHTLGAVGSSRLLVRHQSAVALLARPGSARTC